MALRNNESTAKVEQTDKQTVQDNLNVLQGIIDTTDDFVYVVVMRKDVEGNVTTQMTHQVRVSEVKETVAKISRVLNTARKRMVRSTPVVIREIDENSMHVNKLSVGDFFTSVSELNEALGFDRLRTQTSRTIQRAANRNSKAVIRGVTVSFATYEEVEKAKELGLEL